MDNEEITHIESVIGAYHKLKVDINKEVKALEQDVRERNRNPGAVEAHINQLYKDLWETEERKLYSNVADRANSDSEFEKVFREIFLRIFF